MMKIRKRKVDPVKSILFPFRNLCKLQFTRHWASMMFSGFSLIYMGAYNNTSWQFLLADFLILFAIFYAELCGYFNA